MKTPRQILDDHRRALVARKRGNGPAAVSKIRLPCVHEGGVVEPCQSCGGEGRHVRECDRHGRCTRTEAGKGVAVCARCPDYQPDPSLMPAPPRWKPVPPPVLTPTRDRLVLTAVVGDDAEQMHAATGPAQRRYAERVGADYIVLRNRTQDERMSCAEKWRAKDYVPHYPGGTLWLDADVFVLPDSPDIFEACPADRIGMVDVLPRTPNLREWSAAETVELCRTQGVSVPPGMTKYWNSGVWVGRPPHAGYWEPPPHPFPAKWCTEELWCRVRVYAERMPVHDLDPRFNWTWPEDRQFRTWVTSRPWFCHLAGMGNMDVPGWIQSNREWRQALLRLLAAVV